MNSKNTFFIFMLSALFLVSCGAPGKNDIRLSGKVVIPAGLASEATGPVFVGVSRTDDVELMRNDPENQIVAIVPSDGLDFEIDLSESGLASGDEVFIFAFADNDYNNGIPNPTTGDVIGFYVDSDSLSTRFRLTGGGTELTLNATRRTYDIEPSVIGLIEGTDAGEVILIAYAGDFNSLNFNDLDTDSIIGYKKFVKGSSPCTYELKILPYITPEKYSMPIQSVYIIALLDKNRNGVPDSGDVIGFPTSGAEGDYPMAINIQNSINSCGTIYFRKTVSAPEDPDNPMKLIGKFDAPAGYDGSTPMFIIVAKSGDPGEVFSNMLDTVKYFKNVSAGYNSAEGVFSFDENISEAGLIAGDTVMIIALWDRDFNGGFPGATAGDIAGYLQNKSAFAYTVQLNSGVNNVDRGSDGVYSFNGNPGYDFSLKRTIYNHAASIKYKLEKGNLSDTEFANGNLVQVIALYDATGNSVINKNIDMDNIIASSKVLVQHDLNATVTARYSMNVFPAIPSGIAGINPADFSIPNIYIVGFLDSNGNGRPDTGEKVAFYYKTILFWDAPDKITVVDGANVPGRNIKFSTAY